MLTEYGSAIGTLALFAPSRELVEAVTHVRYIM